jgi:hypothetical protein
VNRKGIPVTNYIERYELAPVVAESMSDPKSALVKLHAVLADLRSKVDAIDSAQTSTDGAKTENPLAAKYSKDEAGAKSATDYVRSNLFDLVSDYIGDDPGRTYHFAEALDLVVKYLRDEKAYHASQMVEARPINRSRKAELKSDYNGIRALFGNVAGMAVASGFDPKSSDVVTIDAAGKPVSVLPGYKGTKSQDDGSVSGRYAKVYQLTWTIDGEDLDEGTRIANIVRSLWHGADRIGKNAKSLTDILDEKVPAWTKADAFTETFEVNGHEVTVARLDDDE